MSEKCFTPKREKRHLSGRPPPRKEGRERVSVMEHFQSIVGRKDLPPHSGRNKLHARLSVAALTHYRQCLSCVRRTARHVPWPGVGESTDLSGSFPSKDVHNPGCAPLRYGQLPHGQRPPFLAAALPFAIRSPPVAASNFEWILHITIFFVTIFFVIMFLAHHVQDAESLIIQIHQNCYTIMSRSAFGNASGSFP